MLDYKTEETKIGYIIIKLYKKVEERKISAHYNEENKPEHII